MPFEDRLPKYIQNADVIFIGKIEEYDYRVALGSKEGFKWHYHRISVSKIFKGSPPETIEYWPETSCDHVFDQAGEVYVFFGRNSDYGTLQFPMLEGTLPLSMAKEQGVLSALGVNTSNKAIKNRATKNVALDSRKAARLLLPGK